jgi:hypothetical protein
MSITAKIVLGSVESSILFIVFYKVFGVNLASFLLCFTYIMVTRILYTVDN